jgi:S1-C subfamily serine protease
MPFRARCPHCQAQYTLGDQYKGGVQVECTRCKLEFRAMPGPASGKTEPKRKPNDRAPDTESAVRQRRPEVDKDPLPPLKANKPNAPRSSKLPLLLIGGGVGALLLLVVCGGGIGIAWWAVAAREGPRATNSAVAGTGGSAPEQQLAKAAPPADQPAPKTTAKGQLSAEALERLKTATVFIKVEAGRGLSCTGSGFLVKMDGDTGYVITNHHVVNPEAELLAPTRGRSGPGLRIIKYKPNNAAVTAVFHSGAKSESALPAEVVSTDESRDLAVLRVRGMSERPRPIALQDKAPIVETMPVYILGFPFGESLSLKKGNPAVTINKGSVSSLREDEYGHMKAVQIDGAINPGNSGGPVVDEDGRLVGISVATIRGSGIGLAIAPDELARMFQGRVGGVGLHPRSVTADLAEFDVEMQLIDPEGQIKSAGLLYTVADSAPTPLQIKDDGTFDPLPGTRRLDVKIDGQKASGQLRLPLTNTSGRLLIFQCVYVNGDGATHHTQIGSRAIKDTAVAQAPPGTKPPAPPDPPKTTETNEPLTGAKQEIGDVSFDEIKLKASDVLPCLRWTDGGKSFYCLEKNGILRQIELAGLKETRRVELGTPCSWLEMSAQGPLVAVPGQQEVWVLDPANLKPKTKIPAPGVVRIASAPTLSVAFAQGKPDPAQDQLSVLDLKKGEIVKQYTGSDLTKNLVGFQFPTATPDGKYLFSCGGIEQLHRFRIDGNALVYEESSERIAQNGQGIEVSPDSQFVALPSGGGNYGASSPYGTFIYSVKKLAKPAQTIAGGAYPRALGFDPKQNLVFAMNFQHPMVVFTDKGIKLKEYELRDAGDTKEFLTHPDGGKLLLLTANRLYLVTLKAK